MSHFLITSASGHNRLQLVVEADNLYQADSYALYHHCQHKDNLHWVGTDFVSDADERVFESSIADEIPEDELEECLAEFEFVKYDKSHLEDSGFFAQLGKSELSWYH